MAQSHRNSEVDMQFVLFTLGQQVYGVEIRRVQRLLQIPSVTPVPGAPDFVEGVTQIRGKVVALINTKRRLGLQDPTWTSQARVIIVELANNEAHIGLIVDAVTEVARIPPENIEPTTQAGISTHDPVAVGIAKHDDRLVILLDPDKVLSESEAAFLQDTQEPQKETKTSRKAA